MEIVWAKAPHGVNVAMGQCDHGDTKATATGTAQAGDSLAVRPPQVVSPQ